MNRGDVWWVNFDPSIGGEIQKRRPAIIVSNDRVNRYLNRVQVVPITTNVARCYPGEVFIALNSNRRKAMADQITTVSKQRIGRFEGRISDADLRNLEHVILGQLGMT